MKIQCFFLFFLFFFTHSIHSENMKELEKKRKNIKLEIEQFNQILKENKKSIGNTLQNLDMIIKQITEREFLINHLKQEITALGNAAEIKRKEIEQLKEKIALQKAKYIAAIQKIYQQKHYQNRWWPCILSTSDLTRSYHKVLYWKEFEKWGKKQVEEILVKKNKIMAEKKLLQEEKKGKSHLITIREGEEKKLQIQEKETKSKVETLNKDKKKLQSEIEIKKTQSKILDKEIERIIKMEIVNARKAIKKDPNIKRKVETEGGYAMTKEEQILSADFSKNKGKLPFPINGNYFIISKFGEQLYGSVEKIRYNNNGIDIKTTQNNTAKAIFDGEITRIFDLPGYQLSVIIRHGNFLTLYSYLEQVFVRKGEKIKTGQNIGKIYTNREKDNSTILHFELWKEQVKLNPEPWFCK